MDGPTTLPMDIVLLVGMAWPPPMRTACIDIYATDCVTLIMIISVTYDMKILRNGSVIVVADFGDVWARFQP